MIYYTDNPTKPSPKLSREAYQKAIKDNYTNYLEQNNYVSPWYNNNGINTETGSMNCINGVCNFISNTTGKKFNPTGSTPGTYIGNATFSDNASNEGFVKANFQDNGFSIGDIIQYGRRKGNPFVRFSGRVTPKNAEELFPQHGVTIADEYEVGGEKYFKIINNRGKNKYKVQDISEKELMSRLVDGFGFGPSKYDGGVVYRYDPERVSENTAIRNKNIAVLEGKNNYSTEYLNATLPHDLSVNDATLGYFRTLGDADNIQKSILSAYQDSYNTLGAGSNMPKKVYDELLRRQLAIAVNESKLGTSLSYDIKDKIPDKVFDRIDTKARAAKDWYTNSYKGIKNWKKAYWDTNADNVKEEFDTYQDFLASENEGNTLSTTTREWLRNNSPRSRGIFQQKEQSERGRHYGYNFDDTRNQALSSLALGIDNYHKIKNKYPHLSDDVVLDIVMQAHSAPSKAYSDRFVNYYARNKDMNYVNNGMSRVKKANSEIPFNVVQKSLDNPVDLSSYRRRYGLGGILYKK